MTAQEQVFKLFCNVCESVPHKVLKKIALPLMIGGQLPADLEIPECLTKYMTRCAGGWQCHQQIKQAIIAVTNERIDAEKGE